MAELAAATLSNRADASPLLRSGNGRHGRISRIATTDSAARRCAGCAAASRAAALAHRGAAVLWNAGPATTALDQRGRMVHRLPGALWRSDAAGSTVGSTARAVHRVQAPGDRQER